MKILISTDIEGIAGVFNAEQTRPGNGEYERARRWMTEEANAAIRGAFAGGAHEVLVNDSHGTFRNLLVEALDPRARFVLGKPRYLGMMAGLEQGCDAVMMVGYQSRGQGRGVLAHTISSFAFARVLINGQELGEAGLYGALAGELGVPVVLGSGDDVFIAENQSLFPHAQWIQTKTATGHASGVTLSPADAQSAIAAGAQRAIGALAHARAGAFCIESPIECQLVTQSPGMADLFCTLPMLRRLDGVSILFSATSMQEAVRLLNSLAAMSNMLR